MDGFDVWDGLLLVIGAYVAVMALVKLMADEGLREQYGKSASALVKENYQWSDYGGKLERLYEVS